jgi:N-acetyl-anhydromuramyl-L-alanine amidase AmpD/subtilisin family serine protease
VSRSPDEEVGAIVRADPSKPLPDGVRVVSRFGSIATIRYPRSREEEVVRSEGIEIMEAATPVHLLDDAEDGQRGRARPRSVPHRPESNQRGAEGTTGRGVVVAAIDWGCDFAHPAFRHPDGTTRLLALWDQRGPGDGAAASNHWGYGRVLDARDIDRALESADPYRALDYHPADADDPAAEEGAHGTHVLDIAAGRDTGNGASGVAPEADLVFVHLDRTARVLGAGNLGDSVAILEALDFVFSVAGDRPCVVNMSVGAHGGPHDGSTLVEQGVDEALSQAAGRAVTNSAGNYFGAEAHAEGRIAQGETVDLPFEVPRDDLTESEVELFYSSADRLVVAVVGPDGEVWAEVAIGQEQELAPNGVPLGRVVHRARHPTSDARHFDLFLYPQAPGGQWHLRLFGEHVEHGRVDAWVEREQGPRPRFEGPWASARSTTGTLCNGRLSITVGAYDPHGTEREMGRFSSAGPTRDGRMKPEIIAPGVRILAACSAARGEEPGARYTTKSGTSMAAPHVAGVVALMFERASRPLEIAETRAILMRSALAPLPLSELADPDDVHRLGVGFVDASRAVQGAGAWARARQAGSFEHEHVAEAGGDTEGVTDMSEVEETADDEHGTFADKLWNLVTMSVGGGDMISTVALSALGREGGRFAPIAESGRRLGDTPMPGDVLTRQSYLGDQAAIVLSGEAVSRDELATRGIPVEAAGPGQYVEVLELRPVPRRIGRRLTDNAGRLARGQTVWRAREGQEAIDVDDVLGEMDGLRCRVIERFAATRGPDRRGFAAPSLHPIDSFNGLGEELTLHGFTVPKLITEPAPVPADDVRWYALPLAQQRAVVLQTRQDLEAWLARQAAYTTNRSLWERERDRLTSLFRGRFAEYNRMWVRLMMYNRFDPFIKRWTDHYNRALSPSHALDPNVVKSVLFQESRMGTHGEHLMPPPSDWSDRDRHPVRSRFNIGQAVDSYGPIQWLMMKEMAADLWRRHHLDTLEARRVWLGMSRADYAAHPTFHVALREFFEARNRHGTNLMGTLQRDLHEDYEFWIRTCVRWLFHKYESQARPSWPAAVEAYNSRGQRGYRAAVMARVGSGAYQAQEAWADERRATREGANTEAASDLGVRLKNRLLRWDDIGGATVDLLDVGGATVRSGVSSNSGRVTLPLAGIADGGYRIRVTPASASAADVGPALGDAAAPDRTWRALTCDVVVANERATSVTGVGAQLAAANQIALTLQPVWIRSPYRQSPRRRRLTHIVIHHTAGPVVGPALNQFLSGRTSAHYVIDTDGEIIKMVHEDDESWHAGCSFWEGQNSVNQFSVGIEVVHRDGPFTENQYLSLIALLGRITQAYPAIRASNIVGHADISTNGDPCVMGAGRHLDNKSGDPGLRFDWARLEAAGFGLQVHHPCYVSVRGIYGGFFDTVPGGELRRDDADATHRYGGAVRAGIQGIVRELQGDLLAVGYYCRTTGLYDPATVAAVQMLQEHFYSAGRQRPMNRGRLDQTTAELIKRLRACKHPQVGDFPTPLPTDPRYAVALPRPGQPGPLAASIEADERDLDPSGGPEMAETTFVPEDLAAHLAGFELKLLADFRGSSVTWSAGSEVKVVTWSNAAVHVTVERGGQSADIPKELLAPNATPSKATYTSAKTSFDVEVPLYSMNLDRLRKLIREGKVAGTDQSNNYKVLNKKLLVEIQLNRFDHLLSAYCSHYHALIGEPKGWVYLSPGWVKSLMIEESTAGSAGKYLVPVPGVPFKNRFNVLQAIDSWGPQQVIMLQELEPKMLKDAGMANIIADRDKLEAEWQRLEAKARRSTSEQTRLDELDKLRFANPSARRSPTWSKFFKTYVGASATTSTGPASTFWDLVVTFLSSGTPPRQDSYAFWIQTGIRWIYEKRKSVETWSDAVRAYNGTGGRAEFYRSIVLARARAAAAAAGINDPIWGGLYCRPGVKAVNATFDLCQFEQIANSCEPRC